LFVEVVGGGSLYKLRTEIKNVLVNTDDTKEKKSALVFDTYFSKAALP
jgi:hypothetical protein